MDRLISRPLIPPQGAAPPAPPAGPMLPPDMAVPPPPMDPGMGIPMGEQPMMGPPMGPELGIQMGEQPFMGDPGMGMGMAPPPPVMSPQNAAMPPDIGMPMAPPPMPLGPQPSSFKLLSEPVDFDDYRPLYPSWLIDKHGKVITPKKPDEARVQSAIASDELKHQRLVDRLLDDLRFYRREHKGAFDDMDPESIELIQSAELPTQVDKIANMLAGVPTQVQWAWATSDEEKTAQLLEDASRELLRRFDEIHRAGGNADLKWEQLWSELVFGRIISRVMPDVADPDFPWDYKLYDPSTVFPRFGGKKGLVRVTAVYQESLDVVLNTYDRPDYDVASRFLQKHKLEREQDLDLNHVAELREYWDGWYRFVEYDGCVCLPVTAHELGYPPFVISLAPGEMGGAHSPDRSRSGLTRREVLAGYAGNSTDDEIDLARKGVSFFHHMKDVVRQEEAVYGLLMIQAKQHINPPINTESPYNGPAKQFDMRPGASNKTRPGEKAQPLLNGVTPADAGPLLQHYKEQRIKGMLPDHMFGAMDQSNISGFAMETMAGAAKDRTLPVISTIESHLTDVVDMALRQYRDFGFLFARDPSGGWPVPAQNRAYLGKQPVASAPSAEMMQQLVASLNGGMPVMPVPGAEAGAAFSSIGAAGAMPARQQETPMLTRRAIMQLGSRPRIRLHKVGTQQLTQMMNVASMAIREKVWSRAHAMEQVDVENPGQMWRQILAEDAKTNPKVLEMVEFPRQLWESGDWEGFFAYFTTVVYPAMLAATQPPPMPGMPAGGGDPMAPGGMQTQQGDSQPMVGQGPGSPSGPGNAALPGGISG